MCHWVVVCVPTSSSVKTGVGIERALALPPSQVIIEWPPPARGAGGPEPPIFNSLPAADRGSRSTLPLVCGPHTRLVANARGMQTFTFRVFRVLKLCKHCIAMLRGLGLASWTGRDSPVPGLALDGPSRAVTAARRGPGQPLGSGLARGHTGV